MTSFKMPTKTQHIDHGWAWVVLISVMVTSFLEMGMSKSFGLYFVEYQKHFGSNATLTSLFPAFYSLINSFSVLPIMTIGPRRFSCRQLVCTGGFCLLLGFVASGWSVNMAMLVVIQGIFVGLGSSFVHAPSLSILGKYFKKRLGLANGLANALGSCGAICLPFLITFLFNTYTFSGAMILNGGLFLHCTLFGALMRPENFHKESTSTEERNTKQVRNKETENKSNISQGAKYSINNKNCEKTNYSEQKKDKKTTKSINISKLRNPTLSALVTVFAFGSIGCNVTIVFIPPFADEKGLNPEETSLLVTIYGVMNGVGKIILGFFSDSKYIKRHQLVTLSLLLTGIVLLLIELCSNKWRIMVFTASYGLLGGALNTLFVPLCIDFFGVDDFMDAVGFLVCGSGLLYAICSPLVGILKDSTGSYKAGFYLMAAFTILAAILLFCIPRLQNKTLRKKDKIPTISEITRL